MATSDFIPNTVTIQLTQGQVTIIDAIDSDLAELKWCADYHPDIDSYYVLRGFHIGVNQWRNRYLHRVIMERVLNRPLLRSEHVDHIHHDTLDNRRSELRLASNAQNHRNSKLRMNSKSGFKGVTYFERTRRWRATIRFNGKNQYLGYFDTPEEAARAYDDAALRLHGEFALLNYPLKA